MNDSPSALNGVQIAAQLLPFLHIGLGCIVTSVVLSRRRELSSAIVLAAIAVAWLVPLVGPVCVLWGLRRRRARPPC